MKENLLWQIWNQLMSAGDAIINAGSHLEKIKEYFTNLANIAAPIAKDFTSLKSTMVKIMTDLRALWDAAF